MKDYFPSWNIGEGLVATLKHWWRVSFTKEIRSYTHVSATNVGKIPTVRWRRLLSVWSVCCGQYVLYAAIGLVYLLRSVWSAAVSLVCLPLSVWSASSLLVVDLADVTLLCRAVTNSHEGSLGMANYSSRRNRRLSWTASQGGGGQLLGDLATAGDGWPVPWQMARGINDRRLFPGACRAKTRYLSGSHIVIDSPAKSCPRCQKFGFRR